MNTNNTNPKSDPGADLRRAAVMAMFARMKETLLDCSPSPLNGERAGVRGDPAERASRMIDTLKLAIQALQTLPDHKSAERTMRSLKKAIQEQEKWKAECERRQARNNEHEPFDRDYADNADSTQKGS